MPKPTKHVKKTDRKKPWYKKRFQTQPYAIESREKAKSFLIICEGENTEPWYFAEQNPCTTVYILIVELNKYL